MVFCFPPPQGLLEILHLLVEVAPLESTLFWEFVPLINLITTNLFFWELCLIKQTTTNYFFFWEFVPDKRGGANSRQVSWGRIRPPALVCVSEREKKGGEGGIKNTRQALWVRVRPPALVCVSERKKREGGRDRKHSASSASLVSASSSTVCVLLQWEL